MNALLEHLSRLNDTPGVVVLGATNYPDMIDPAVLRPGRFDQKIEITNPDKASVLNILELTLGRDTKDMIFSPIADQLLGSSGAKVAAFVREARGLAREEQRPLDQCHLETAATHICPALPPDVLWRVAVHEAGHLVVAYELGLPSAAGAAVTSTGGFVDIPSPQLESAQSAKDRIVALLGGRAAEKIILGEAFNGAGLGENSDLELATRLAEQIHSQWGFGDQLAYRELNKDPLNSQGSMQIEPAMQKAQGSALQIVEQKLELVIKIANALLIERELTAAQIQSLLEHDSPSNLTVSSN